MLKKVTGRNDDFSSMTGGTGGAGLIEESNELLDPNKESLSLKMDSQARQAQLKNFIGERLRQENIRSTMINKELGQMRGNLRPAGSQRAAEDPLYPLTTNQEYIN
jgi:hypothetical protein